jgi:ABC-type glycerol-3-phosphate transport system substrate-binding protein
MFRKSFLITAAVVLAAACSGEPGNTSDSPRIDRDTLTQRQKDSITATLPLPGAGVVGRALEVTDAVADRAARHDSMAVGNR